MGEKYGFQDYMGAQGLKSVHAWKLILPVSLGFRFSGFLWEPIPVGNAAWAANGQSPR